MLSSSADLPIFALIFMPRVLIQERSVPPINALSVLLPPSSRVITISPLPLWTLSLASLSLVVS